MPTLRSTFLDVFQSRGMLHQCTDLEGLDALFSAHAPVPVYIGFDCTADSLHVGSLLQIMALRRLQQCGHRPVILLGSATTRVGDPSGKDASRQLLDDDAIARNKAGIQRVFNAFLSFGDAPTDALLVDNAEWLDTLNYIDFLREYGRHFTVNRMLTFESVRLRLEREQPLTFLEFNYMLLQAYDFEELYRRHGCRVQIGGSDQWGNIINGIELHRRLHADDDAREELFGLTTPLITTASGAKMGKTADGAVWLDAARCTPYDYWQFWRNTEDADVGRFLRYFTELPLEEITRLESLEGSARNDAKKILATEATALCHGWDAAENAADTARQAFEQGIMGGDLPVTEIPRSDLEAGIPAFALFHRAGLAASGGEARRLIRGGGGKINGEKISDENHPVTLDAANDEGLIPLSAGKKRHALVRAV